MCENIAGEPLLLFLLAIVAQAGGPWSGIDPHTLPMVGDPVYMHPESGWSAAVLDAEQPGRLRVFVGRTDDEASTWLATQRGLRASRPPVFPVGDEGYGNGSGLILARDGNVALLVERPSGGAQDLAKRIFDGLVEGVSWPRQPVLFFDGHLASVVGTWAQVSFLASPTLDPKTFLPAAVPVMPRDERSAVIGGTPRRLAVVVWDRFGRSVSADWVSDDAPSSSPDPGGPAPTGSEIPSP